MCDFDCESTNPPLIVKEKDGNTICCRSFGQILYRSQFAGKEIDEIFLSPFTFICVVNADKSVVNYYCNFTYKLSAYDQYKSAQKPGYYDYNIILVDPNTNEAKKEEYRYMYKTNCEWEQGSPKILMWNPDGTQYNPNGLNDSLICGTCVCASNTWNQTWDKIYVNKINPKFINPPNIWLEEESDLTLTFAYDDIKPVVFKFENAVRYFSKWYDYDRCELVKNSIKKVCTNSKCKNCAENAPNTCINCDFSKPCVNGCLSFNICNNNKTVLSLNDIDKNNSFNDCINNDNSAQVFNKYCFIETNSKEDNYYKYCDQISQYLYDERTPLNIKSESILNKIEKNDISTQEGIFNILPKLWCEIDYDSIISNYIEAQKSKNVKFNFYNTGKIEILQDQLEIQTAPGIYPLPYPSQNNLETKDVNYEINFNLQNNNETYNWLSSNRKYILRKEKSGKYCMYLNVYNSSRFNDYFLNKLNNGRVIYKKQYIDLIENANNTYKTVFNLVADSDIIDEKFQPYMCIYTDELADLYGFTPEKLDEIKKINPLFDPGLFKEYLSCGPLCKQSTFGGDDIFPMFYIRNQKDRCPDNICLTLVDADKIDIKDQGRLIIEQTCNNKSDCQNNKCQNGSDCISDPDEPDNYRCKCTSGFSGKYCEIKDDPEPIPTPTPLPDNRIVYGIIALIVVLLLGGFIGLIYFLVKRFS